MRLVVLSHDLSEDPIGVVVLRANVADAGLDPLIIHQEALNFLGDAFLQFRVHG